MRTSLVLAIFIATSLLGGCSTTNQPTTQAASKFAQSPTQVASNFIQRQNVVPTTKDPYPAKNPQTVALFKHEQRPSMPYRVIGVATVSKYNLLGIQREEDTLNKMMKTLAASIGGDGVINMNTNNDTIEAKVIAFQRILL